VADPFALRTDLSLEQFRADWKSRRVCPSHETVHRAWRRPLSSNHASLRRSGRLLCAIATPHRVRSSERRNAARAVTGVNETGANETGANETGANETGANETGRQYLEV
jgi:hypothetical protein